jgi:hypothetical protein
VLDESGDEMMKFWSGKFHHCRGAGKALCGDAAEPDSDGGCIRLNSEYDCWLRRLNLA